MSPKNMSPMYRAAHGALDPVRCPRCHHRETVDLVARRRTAHVTVHRFTAYPLCELVLSLPNSHT